MNTLNKLKNYLFSMTLLLGVIACSSKSVVHNYPVSASPAEEIARLESDLKVAGEKQVDILSPKNFEKAQEALDDAKEKYSKGRDSQQVLKEVAKGNTYLQDANAAASVSRENAEDVVAARQAALEANAPDYFEREFKKADKDFARVTMDIEKNKMKKVAKSRAELQEKYLELELKAIKENYLRESRNTVELAKKEGAKEFAPRTLAIAEKSLLDTESYITANRHNTGEIMMRARETREAANHVLNINRVAKGTEKVSSEEIALSMEKEKSKVAMKEGQLEMVEDKLQTTQSALDRQREAERDAQRELEAIKERDEKYELARKEFSSKEAEVYKQGDSLLIRLKGMEFPSAKSTIQTKNYPLLSKVQKIIGKFGTGTTVTVEGHTDSVGGKKLNEKLSTERAMAVKEYLETNSGGIETEIEAVGFGDEKPLAGNKTATGRAQNRRVDIIIKPESTKL